MNRICCKKRNLIFTFISFFLFENAISVSSFAQSHISTQAHETSVNQVIPLETSSSLNDVFISGGNDGYLINWLPDGTGEHYQISELQIKLIAHNPSNSEVAVYETDGISINRVSVWDLKTLVRKYAKRFSDSITSISYSEKGSYLIIGTAAVNGIYFLNADSGTIAFKPTDVSNIISMSKTSASEKSAIFYSSTGSLIYYDVTNNKIKAKFQTESQLTQPMLFGTGEVENCFFAGVKNNTIYIVNALSGKTIAQYQAQKALIFSSQNENESNFYFISQATNGYSLKSIDFTVLKNQTKASSKSILNPPAPFLIKKFTNLSNKDSFTCASKNMTTVFLGTQSGNIYKMNTVSETENLTLFPITEKLYDRIYDFTSDDTKFYFLTKNSIFASSYDNSVISRVGNNNSQTNIIKYKDGVILWSKDTRKSVQFVSLSNGGTATPKLLFTPSNSLQVVRLFGDKIVFVQGNSSVNIFDIPSMQNAEIYSGTSVQDAILYNDTDLYVAKTSAVDPATPLIQVNIVTKETVPLKISGTLAYSLSHDSSRENSPIYGITVTVNEDDSVTKVFSFSPSEMSLTNLLQLKDEDPNAFTYLNYPLLYTNIGKNNIRSYNLETRENVQLKRSASMPIKIEVSGSRIAVLNRDGSISWYDSNSSKVIADWYLTNNGDWFEF